MFADILPPSVKVVERRSDNAAATLFNQEAAALGFVSATRRHEFTQTRDCAHEALGLLGLPPCPIARGLAESRFGPRA
jgi:4'-phosphopantetheinyl transferase EntD